MGLQEVGCRVVDWIALAQDRDSCRALVTAVMNLRDPQNAGNFLTSWKPVSFSRRTLLHGVSKELSKLLPSGHSLTLALLRVFNAPGTLSDTPLGVIWPELTTLYTEVVKIQNAVTRLIYCAYFKNSLNLLAPEFYIKILAHPVCKMWILQEPKKVAIWNKRHFEEKNRECAACLKYSVLIFVEKNIYKMQHLEGSGTPVLYIGRTVFKV